MPPEGTVVKLRLEVWPLVVGGGSCEPVPGGVVRGNSGPFVCGPWPVRPVDVGRRRPPLRTHLQAKEASPPGSVGAFLDGPW